MDIITLFFYYGIFALLFSALVSFIIWIIEAKKEHKLKRKHLVKRKNIFLLLSLFSLIIIWSQAESAFSQTTLSVLWGLHFASFIGFLGYSVHVFLQDKNRIEAAQRRRKIKEANS